jgi:hypothetical protein
MVSLSFEEFCRASVPAGACSQLKQFSFHFGDSVTVRKAPRAA